MVLPVIYEGDGSSKEAAPVSGWLFFLHTLSSVASGGVQRGCIQDVRDLT